MKGKQLRGAVALMEHLANGGEVLEIRRSGKNKETTETTIFTAQTVISIDTGEHEYYEYETYNGPFGNLMFNREKGIYEFSPDPMGKYVRREDFEALTEEE